MLRYLSIPIIRAINIFLFYSQLNFTTKLFDTPDITKIRTKSSLTPGFS